MSLLLHFQIKHLPTTRKNVNQISSEIKHFSTPKVSGNKEALGIYCILLNKQTKAVVNNLNIHRCKGDGQNMFLKS